MCLLVYVLSGLVESLLAKRGLAALLSDVAPSVQSPRGLTLLLAGVTHSVCPFWFSRGLAESGRAGFLAFLCGS